MTNNLLIVKNKIIQKIKIKQNNKNSKLKSEWAKKFKCNQDLNLRIKLGFKLM